MAVEVSIDATERLLNIKVAGTTTAQEVADAYASGFQDPGYETSMNCVWDIRDLKLSQFSIGEVRELTRLLRQYSDQRGSDYKVAYVTSNRGDFQLLRVYSSFIKLVGSFRMKVFDDMNAAREWLQQGE